jgi:acetate kinase
MRTLLASSRQAAREAVDLFCYRVAQSLAAMAVALDGLDAVVFTGGIGQYAAPVRARIAAHSRILGLILDPVANQSHHSVVSAPDSSVRVRVLATDEESVIARHTAGLLQGLSAGEAC